MTDLKPQPKNSHENPQEAQAAKTKVKTEAQKWAIESKEKEIVVFPEATDEYNDNNTERRRSVNYGDTNEWKALPLKKG